MAHYKGNGKIRKDESTACLPPQSRDLGQRDEVVYNPIKKNGFELSQQDVKR
jgi:hypothetical protein